jgi:hypothetical protein
MLVGEPLWVVGFTPDETILRFGGPEGPPLVSRHPPVIRRGGTEHVIGEPGYRDALCASLGVQLANGYVTEGEVILELDDGTRLSLSLHDETDGVAPEVVELHAPDGLWILP